MLKTIILAAAITLVPAMGIAQNPQGARGGATGGAAAGAAAGAVVGGPVGAVAGGVGGAVVGGIVGDNTPRFKEYVVEQRVPSYSYRQELRVGTVLPQRGVTYRTVPAEYGVRKGYRYTVVNDQPVLVEPRTRRVIQVIE
ncbi:hypothetical protein FG93_01108 [Bosea sp. LC85]|uniref:DUF1236 domain-containing protein n=1 Tax=Bosea sp. LC85 TaxID=1502851 RepID=UPI0004E2F191|nr:DUF1236 domain-containing protein [Bosea sp. LC85]KFC74522.1 hypothetical protein FG93_01108 [Bosea sp. LC85]